MKATGAPSLRSRRSLAGIAILVLVGLIYFATGLVGLHFAPVERFATLVWPPAGIALAALVLFGTKMWPAIAVGAFAVNFVVGGSPQMAATIAVGNTLEALIGAWALLRIAGGRPSFERTRDVLALVVAAAVSTPVSATIGVAALGAAGLTASGHVASTWRAWQLGDVTADLTLAPLILTWVALPRWLHAPRRRVVEAVALAACTIATSLFVFSLWPPARSATFRLTYWFTPFFIWASLRFGAPGATSTMFLVKTLAVYAALLGRSMFRAATPQENLVALQSFVMVGAVTYLFLAAAFTERAQARRALRGLNANLERRVAQRTRELIDRQAQLALAQRIGRIGSFTWDLRADVLQGSDELFSLLRVPPSDFDGTLGGLFAHLDPEDRELATRDVEACARDGEPRIVEVQLHHVGGSSSVMCVHAEAEANDSGVPVRVVVTCQDVTADRAREEEIRETARQKELLLREMHHRVKNNLQIISSLLKLQRRAIADERLQGVLDDCESRVRSIALAHEKLSASADFTTIDCQPYLKGLVATLLGAYGHQPNLVSMAVDAQNCALSIDRAIACGLIVNELVANSLKHAFAGTRRGGRVLVALHRDDAHGQDVLEVSDDGIGLPRDVDPKSTSTLGLKLVGSLVAQLRGVMAIDRHDGTRFVIRFPTARV